MQKSASISKLRVDTPGAERRIGKYAFIASLASGGMAKVYLAVTRGTQDFKKLVVIKEMLPKLAADPAFVEMFMNEARIAARLNHPNVIQTYEVGSEGSRHFLAMEYLDGVPYTRLARQKDRVGVPLVLHVRILLDVLAGLHYAHELADFDGTPLHVVHRDVSPQNILLTYDGHVKLLDFGIAKAVSSEPDKKGSELKGKVSYMAPEQITGLDVDRRADVFCVGIQLWEAVAGRRLWDRSSGVSIPHQVLFSEIPDVRKIRPEVPQRLAEICARALARPPGERYATAAEMEKDLEDFLEQTGQRVATRDVGAFIVGKYASERKQMRSIIDKQLRELGAFTNDEPARIELAQLARPMLSDRPSAPAPSLSDAGSSPAAVGVPGVPAAVSSAALPTVPPESTAPGSEDSASGVWKKESVAPLAATPVVASTPAGRGSRLTVIAVAVVMLCVGGVVASRVMHKRAGPVVKVDSKPVTPPAIVPAAPGVPVAPLAAAGSAVPFNDAHVVAQIDFKIKASPADAKISIDDELVGVSPSVGTRPKDDKAHSVRVEAPGYEPKIESVEFSRDFFLAVELKRASRVGNGTWNPAPTPANKLNLDVDNPYKK